MNAEIFNNLNGRILSRWPGDSFKMEPVLLAGKIPALYEDERFRVISDEYVTLDSRCSDDGEYYFATLEPKVMVNFSGRFVVAKQHMSELEQFQVGEDAGWYIPVCCGDDDGEELCMELELSDRQVTFDTVPKPVIFFENNSDVDGEAA